MLLFFNCFILEMAKKHFTNVCFVLQPTKKKKKKKVEQEEPKEEEEEVEVSEVRISQGIKQF